MKRDGSNGTATASWYGTGREHGTREPYGSTDLGRRIREQRHRSGLSREEAAESAGVAATYLAYLETSQDASPAPETLGRLARALGTTTRSLTGAGLELPPGRQEGEAHALIESMSTAECLTYLGSGGVGRFVYVDARGPVAVPVNYRMLGGDIVFATGADSSLASRAGQRRVSFEVDHVDDALAEGWSVLVSGRAHVVTHAGELREVRSLGIAPWPAGTRQTFIRIVAVEITGRRIRVT